MATNDYNSTLTGAFCKTAIENADAGNIGKSTQTAFTGDIDTLTSSGFFYVSSSASNNPAGETGMVYVGGIASTSTTQVYQSASSTSMYIRRKISSTWSSWQEIYHTGNTGVLGFANTVSGTQEEINYSTTEGVIRFNRPFTTGLIQQFNSSATVAGSINITSGTSVSYATSSDPRLKDFKGKPDDNNINSMFSKLFDSFNTFNWKTDPNGELVWGFDAHKAIDNGLDMGIEGQGDRTLKIGDKYKDAVLDEDGNEIEPALYVTPAGVDQSKAVPILLAKLEQLERRLKVLEGN